MATNEHQTHDLFHPTCERCHEEMFGSVGEVAEEAYLARESAVQADPSTNLNEVEKVHLNDLYGRLSN